MKWVCGVLFLVLFIRLALMLTLSALLTLKLGTLDTSDQTDETNPPLEASGSCHCRMLCGLWNLGVDVRTYVHLVYPSLASMMLLATPRHNLVGSSSCSL